jgi:murein L,D-transpeptidase YafK
MAATQRSRRRWVLPAFLILVASVFLILRWSPTAFREVEHEAIRFERLMRATLFRAGLALPGTPDLAKFNDRLNAHGVALGAPVFLRIFKRDFELELWMLRDGRFHRFATYPICRWSGRLGPKLAEGDRQAPEGFYSVDKGALNPNSRWHRSFNLGYPNKFDRAHGRTGSLLMVHGGCGSIGCYAMTDPVIDEVWRLVTAALSNGQARFQVQVFPFRMTEENLKRHATSPLAPFWRNLKQGSDLFEKNLLPPKVGVCEGRYSFEASRSPEHASEPIASTCFASAPSP